MARNSTASLQHVSGRGRICARTGAEAGWYGRGRPGDMLGLEPRKDQRVKGGVREVACPALFAGCSAPDSTLLHRGWPPLHCLHGTWIGAWIGVWSTTAKLETHTHTRTLPHTDPTLMLKGKHAVAVVVVAGRQLQKWGT